MCLAISTSVSPPPAARLSQGTWLGVCRDNLRQEGFDAKRAVHGFVRSSSGKAQSLLTFIKKDSLWSTLFISRDW